MTASPHLKPRPLSQFRLAALLLAVMLVCCGAGWAVDATPTPTPAVAATATVHLVILHVNDEHGNLAGTAQGGGAARLHALVNRIRQENPGRVLLLHAGDILSRGDDLTTVYAGAVNFAVMAKTGFDALTPGNGDFYFGIANLQALAKTVTFPVLHANSVLVATGQPPFKAALEKELAGVRVAIIGVGYVKPDHPSCRDLRVEDAVTVLRRQAVELRPRTDLLVGLTHVGLHQDVRAATEVPELDLIVGGHTHSLLAKPIRLPRKQGGGELLIMQAGENGAFLGRVDVDMEKTGGHWRVQRADAALLPVNAETPEAPEILTLLRSRREELAKPVTTLAAPLPAGTKQQCPVGDFIVQAMLAAVPGADAALLDRAAVEQGLQVGAVSLADIARVHPFRNRLVRLLCRAADLAPLLGKGGVLAAGCEVRRAAVPHAPATLFVRGVPVPPEQRLHCVVAEYLWWTTPVLRKLQAEETDLRVDTLLLKALRDRAAAPGHLP